MNVLITLPQIKNLAETARRAVVKSKICGGEAVANSYELRSPSPKGDKFPRTPSAEYFTVSYENTPDYFLSFMDRKPNIIMDGFFTKIMISTSFCTMNGIFLSIGFQEFPRTRQEAEYRINSYELRSSEFPRTPSTARPEYFTIKTGNSCREGMLGERSSRFSGDTTRTKIKELRSPSAVVNSDELRSPSPKGDKFLRTPSATQAEYFTIFGRDEVSYENAEPNKYYIYFDPYAIENRYTTETIIQLEETILQMYTANSGELRVQSSSESQGVAESGGRSQSAIFGRDKVSYENSTPYLSKISKPLKTPVYLLKTQLQGGGFKIHRDKESCLPEMSIPNRYILKISGVWESKHSYGITCKCTPDYRS